MKRVLMVESFARRERATVSLRESGESDGQRVGNDAVRARHSSACSIKENRFFSRQHRWPRNRLEWLRARGAIRH
jgi:hypothetical protein